MAFGSSAIAAAADANSRRPAIPIAHFLIATTPSVICAVAAAIYNSIPESQTAEGSRGHEIRTQIRPVRQPAGFSGRVHRTKIPAEIHRMRGYAMTAFNAVRFRIKAGREQEFLEAHRKAQANWPGLQHANIIKTGERSYCIIAEWSDMDALVKARPDMIATLDGFRDTLEDLGGGLGVTDPVSGPVVLALK
jgi:hypothetical protein